MNPNLSAPEGRPDGYLVRRSALPVKARKANLHAQYRTTIQISLLAALTVAIGLFHLPLRPGGSFEAPLMEQEVVQMEEISQTRQEYVPPPAAPPPPMVVSDDVTIDDVPLSLDASLDIDKPLPSLPPPPAPPAEKPAATSAPKVEEEIEVFVVVEQMPEMLPSPEEGMRQLQELLRYPEIALKAGVEGRVYVEFIIDERGLVRDPRVLRGIGAGCDEEAVRAVTTLKFKPGRQRGKPVRVKFAIPVTFRLRDAQS